MARLSLRHWLDRMAPRSGRRRAERVNRQGGPPRLEVLEDRCLPSSSVTDLGTLGGRASDALAPGIHASGQVVRQAVTDGGTLRRPARSRAPAGCQMVRSLPPR